MTDNSKIIAYSGTKVKPFTALNIINRILKCIGCLIGSQCNADRTKIIAEVQNKRKKYGKAGLMDG